MKDLQRRIQKLERLRDLDAFLDEKAIEDYFNELDIHPIERAAILMNLGLLEPETFIGLIIEACQIKDDSE